MNHLNTTLRGETQSFVASPKACKRLFLIRSIRRISLLCFFIGFISTTNVSAGYCPLITLTTQQEIDDFPATYSTCDSVGELRIFYDGVGIINIDALHPLIYIGTLNISCVRELASFYGLRNCLSIDNVIIRAILPNKFQDFPVAPLLSMNSLHLTSAYFRSFEGLDSLKHLGVLKLTTCPWIVDFDHLENLETLDELNIKNCDKLFKINLSGLDELNKIEIEGLLKFKWIEDLGNVRILQELRILGSQYRHGSGRLTMQHSLEGVLGAGINIGPTNYQEIVMPSIDSVSALDLNGHLLQNVTFKGLKSEVLRELSISAALLPEITFANPDSQLVPYEINELTVGTSTDFDFSFLANTSYLGEVQITTKMTEWPFAQLQWLDNLNLTGNSELSDCCTLLPTIFGNRIGSYTISYNDYGCSSFYEIFNQCGPSVDADQDGVLDVDDNCINDFNKSQTDSDGDGIGDVCDNCPQIANADQADLNGNKIGDACEDANYNTKLSVENGDAVIDVSSGLILRGVDDNCYRIVVDGVGELRTKIVPCP